MKGEEINIINKRRKSSNQEDKSKKTRRNGVPSLFSTHSRPPRKGLILTTILKVCFKKRGKSNTNEAEVSRNSNKHEQ